MNGHTSADASADNPAATNFPKEFAFDTDGGYNGEHGAS
jgi:hypothetical protein